MRPALLAFAVLAACRRSCVATLEEVRRAVDDYWRRRPGRVPRTHSGAGTAALPSLRELAASRPIALAQRLMPAARRLGARLRRRDHRHGRVNRVADQMLDGRDGRRAASGARPLEMAIHRHRDQLKAHLRPSSRFVRARHRPAGGLTAARPPHHRRPRLGGRRAAHRAHAERQDLYLRQKAAEAIGS